MAFSMQHVQMRYLIYRNGDFECPDEAIETTNELDVEVVTRLRSDATIDRVDLEIHQISTWTDYLSLAKNLAKQFVFPFTNCGFLEKR